MLVLFLPLLLLHWCGDEPLAADYGTHKVIHYMLIAFPHRIIR